MKRLALVALPQYEAYFAPLKAALLMRDWTVLDVLPSEPGGAIELASSCHLVATVHSTVPEISALMGALRGKVPTLTLQDGIIEHRHSTHRGRLGIYRYRPLSTDRIAVFGDTSRAILVSYGVEPERIVVAGSIRFDWASDRETALGTDLLVATSNRPSIGVQATAAFYRQLAEVLAVCSRSGVPVRFRPGRGLRAGGVCALETVSDLLPPELLHAMRDWQPSTAALEADLASARAVITTPSTLSLEAMAMRRPVAHMLYDDETVYLNPPWRIDRGSDVEAVVRQLLDPPDLKMRFQGALLSMNLAEGDALGRVCALMEEMALARAQS